MHVAYHIYSFGVINRFARLYLTVNTRGSFLPERLPMKILLTVPAMFIFKRHLEFSKSKMLTTTYATFLYKLPDNLQKSF